jgi:hypothetical protein
MATAIRKAVLQNQYNGKYRIQFENGDEKEVVIQNMYDGTYNITADDGSWTAKTMLQRKEGLLNESIDIYGEDSELEKINA